MFDMRYHIASLVAVFFALAIGILLGTVIVDKGILVEQEKALVQRIERNISELRGENFTLREEVTAQREFAEGIIPLALKDRLAGKNVVIVSTTAAKSGIVTEVSDGLHKASATVGIITVKEDFKLTPEGKESLIPYLSTELNDGNARELILKKLVSELTAQPPMTSTTTTNPANQSADYVSKLKELGLITVESTIDRPVASAIILGGTDSNTDPKNTDLHMIPGFKLAGVRVIGAEVSNCKNSYIQAYQEAGIPTVDNVDQPTGIISVVYALNGSDGNFGIKESAEQLMPALISP